MSQYLNFFIFSIVAQSIMLLLPYRLIENPKANREGNGDMYRGESNFGCLFVGPSVHKSANLDNGATFK